MEIGEIACAAPAWSYRGCTLNTTEAVLLKNIPKLLLTKTSLLILEEISVEFTPHIQKYIRWKNIFFETSSQKGMFW